FTGLLLHREGSGAKLISVPAAGTVLQITKRHDIIPLLVVLSYADAFIRKIHSLLRYTRFYFAPLRGRTMG
ncbi:MAG: hypothetical protein RSC98_10395, partial [Clostridia bacterium]